MPELAQSVCDWAAMLTLVRFSFHAHTVFKIQYSAHPYLKRTDSVTKKTKWLKLLLKKFRHTKRVSGRSYLITYLNSV